MKERTLFVVAALFVLSGVAVAQEVRTVTNADLEKYRQKRLQAERDLRENYAEMGFPSPEEIEQQNEESRRSLNEFADQLREERLERESRRYRRAQNSGNGSANPLAYPAPGFIDYGNYYSTGAYYYGGRYYYGGGKYRRGNRRFHRRGKDFRDRFIRGLPDYIRRTHRFNTFDTGRNLPRPVRRSLPRRPRGRN